MQWIISAAIGSVLKESLHHSELLPWGHSQSLFLLLISFKKNSNSIIKIKKLKQNTNPVQTQESDPDTQKQHSLKAKPKVLLSFPCGGFQIQSYMWMIWTTCCCLRWLVPSHFPATSWVPIISEVERRHTHIYSPVFQLVNFLNIREIWGWSDNKARKGFEKRGALNVMGLLCYAKHSFYACTSMCEGKYGCHVWLEVWEEA